MTTETDEQRSRRERLRGLFDGVAGLYDATRQGYPAEIVDAICARSGIGPDAGVLEIGCGTGQLTRRLALLATEERCPEPLRTRLRELWMRYSRRTAAWTVAR